MTTDRTNDEMRRFWTDVAGPRWVRDRENHDRVLAPFLDALLEAADASPGERVLDVGCGTGTSTLALADRVGPDGSVVGVDVSEPMLAELERRASARPVDSNGAPIQALLADAQVDRLPGPFDLVTSRHGVMFFADQPAAWRHLRTATRPGGRLAFVCWQRPEDSVWPSLPSSAALGVSPAEIPPPGPEDPGAHRLADPERTRSLLVGAGWRDVVIADLRPVLPIGRDLDDAVTHSRGLQSVVAAIERAGEHAIIPAIRSALEPYVTDDGSVHLPSATWLVTATA